MNLTKLYLETNLWNCLPVDQRLLQLISPLSNKTAKYLRSGIEGGQPATLIERPLNRSRKGVWRN